MRRKDTIPEIWLEVSNIALNEGEAPEPKVSIDVQLKGDSEDDRWLTFNGGVDKFKPLMEAMKDKRPIHAKLTPARISDSGKKVTTQDNYELKITELRISFSVSPVRS